MPADDLLARLETTLAVYPPLQEQHEAYDTAEHVKVLWGVAQTLAASGDLAALAELVASVEAEARP